MLVIWPIRDNLGCLPGRHAETRFMMRDSLELLDDMLRNSATEPGLAVQRWGIKMGRA